MRWTAFNVEDHRDGTGVQRIRSESIDGLGGQRHDLTCAQQLGSASHGLSKERRGVGW